jgi:hypothetical protein
MFEGATAVRGFLEDFRSGYESFDTEPASLSGPKDPNLAGGRA